MHVPTHEETPGASASFPYATRFSNRHAPIAYFDTGEGRATPRGETFVCLHGLGANFTHFEHLAARLAPRHRVLGVDMPGCGESAMLAISPRFRYTLRLYAEATIRLCDQLAIASPIFVGHSFGGAVAVEAALLHPSRARGLVLCDSAGFHRYKPWTRLAARLVLRPGLVSPVMERLAFNVLDLVFQDKNRYVEKFLADTRGKPHHPTVDEFAITACSLAPDLVRRDFLDLVEQIRPPTLVVWGDRDKLLPVSEVQRWFPRLPHGRLRVMAGCGHMPIIERPVELAAEIEAFVREEVVRPAPSPGATTEAVPAG